LRGAAGEYCDQAKDEPHGRVALFDEGAQILSRLSFGKSFGGSVGPLFML